MKNEVKDIDLKKGSLYYSPKEKVMVEISNQILRIAIILCIAVVIFSYYFSSAEIQGISMLPTYNSQSVIDSHHTDVAYYTTRFDCQRGDVVIPDFKDGSGEKYLIKRLIAVGGDKVEFIDYELYVNGEKVDEYYITNTSRNKVMIENFMLKLDANGNVILRESNIYSKWKHITLDTENISSTHISFTVDDGYVFYLGDNRGVSYDCSSYGPQSEDIIVAKVVFVKSYGQSLISAIWQNLLKWIFNYH